MTDDGRVVANRYRLGRRIGSGAMGVVWEAYDELLYRTVAVKQLLVQPGQGEQEAEEAKRRAMREGRIAARLQHPNAVAVYDVVDEGDGMPWLVMEYVPSRSLSAVLEDRGSLHPKEVARIGMHVASALAAAHAAGIVHRDVKPGNVLLGEDGTVKITDFGISRAVGDATVTATGVLAGTPAYLAPEIAKGQDPSTSSDVFSLGATLYAAVEGVPPFGVSDNPLALLHKVASGRVTPPEQAGPLAAPLMALLSDEPTERASMTQVRDALGEIAAGRRAPALIAAAAPTAGERVTATGTRMDIRPVQAHGGPDRTTALPRGTAGRQVGSASPRLNRPAALGIAAAVVVAIVVGILAATLNSNHDSAQSGQGGSTTSSTATDQQSSQQERITSQPSGEQEVKLIVDYYDLLASSPQAAWAKLSPGYQATFQGGFSAWKTQWSGKLSLVISNVHQTQPYVVEADEHFTNDSGARLRQPVLFSIRWEGTSIFVDREQKLGPPQSDPVAQPGT